MRLDEAFDVAELAIEVVDGWQRRGVGMALMAALAERARAAGIRRFHVSMLRENRAARKLANHLGPATVLSAAGSLVEISYSVSAVLGGGRPGPRSRLPRSRRPRRPRRHRPPPGLASARARSR